MREFTYQPKWDPIGFDPQPNVSALVSFLPSDEFDSSGRRAARGASHRRIVSQVRQRGDGGGDGRGDRHGQHGGAAQGAEMSQVISCTRPLI